MKVTTLIMLLVSTASAHYAPRSAIIDGITYRARDARLDDWVGAKRIEWSYTDQQNFTWHAINNDQIPDIACGLNPVAPPLKAYARAGADVTIQWTGIPRQHLGPSMSYLGAWTPGQSPNQVDFFKISGRGYNKTGKLWANEEDFLNGNKDQFKIPSDIKPGTYILRTELLSLHGNGQYANPGLLGLPQFYTHCFNVEISGTGTATPTGVKFPGAYPKNDPGVHFILGTASQYATYPVPGPPVYSGKYDSPTGPAPNVTEAQKGNTFPADFEIKYKTLVDKFTAWSDKAVAFFDSGTGGANFITVHQAEGNDLVKQRASLRQEAIAAGLADAKQPMQNSQIF